MNYEKAYNEALERAKMILCNIPEGSASVRDIETIFPELRESEDERIRKALVKEFEDKVQRCFEWKDGIPNNAVLRWLEKQKEQKPSCWNSPVMTHEMIMNEQKEPHYTKRNALFDKCVENCDPKTVEEVNKRVDDIMNMPELSAFEQALTNFIGYWEDDEERWPSQFVKKHGKHILDMAREELQKEQKPNFSEKDSTDFEIEVHEIIAQARNDSRLDDADVLKQFEEEAAFALMLKANKLIEQKPVEPSDDELQRHQDELYDFKVFAARQAREHHISFVHDFEWNNFCAELLSYFHEQKPEWSEEDEKMIDDIIRALPKMAEAEDNILPEILPSVARKYVERLKSLRPSWKPSEEQIYSLGTVVKGYNECTVGSVGYNLKELYDQLNKLKEDKQ